MEGGGGRESGVGKAFPSAERWQLRTLERGNRWEPPRLPPPEGSAPAPAPRHLAGGLRTRCSCAETRDWKWVTAAENTLKTQLEDNQTAELN